MKVSSASVILSAVTAVLAAPVPDAPGVPNTDTARTLLNGLKVGTPSAGDDYDRDLFPHWETIEGACNAREFVLKRDGTDVKSDDECKAVSGTWVSPYDGNKFTDAQEIDIDHMVPLKNAWISGASEWTTKEREGFANDITRPQLWASSRESNRAKSADSPDKWKPSEKSFWCTYSKSWIQVKSHYKLTITDAEKGALSGMLDSCT